MQQVVVGAVASVLAPEDVGARRRPELRRQMYMFAIRSITKDGMFREYYDRCVAANPQKPAKKILIAIARDAARMMFSIAKERRLYTPTAPL